MYGLLVVLRCVSTSQYRLLWNWSLGFRLPVDNSQVMGQMMYLQNASTLKQPQLGNTKGPLHAPKHAPQTLNLHELESKFHKGGYVAACLAEYYRGYQGGY